MGEDPQVTIGNYVLHHTVGQGAFSRVRVGVHTPTQIRVAVKVLAKKGLKNAAAQERLRREIVAMSHSDHPFIAKFFDVLEDDTHVYLVQELASGGNMLNSVNSRGGLTEDQARKYFAQLLSAMEYLHHNLHVMHRDLKAENVLLDKYDNVRLIDFGLCNILQDEAQVMKTACGSPAYAPPEMIQGHAYNHTADTWSLGVLLFAIADCQLPFDDGNVQRLLQKIVYTEPRYPSTFSPELTDLLKRMLEKSPERRIPISEIRDHPWIRDYLVDNQVRALKSVVKHERVMSKIVEIGYDRGEVEAALANGELQDGVVSYWIVHRKMLTESMRNMSLLRSSSADALVPQAEQLTDVKLAQRDKLPSLVARTPPRQSLEGAPRRPERSSARQFKAPGPRPMPKALIQPKHFYRARCNSAKPVCKVNT